MPPDCHLTIVVPVFNEAESLKLLDKEIREMLYAAELNAEVIYVDDFSIDGSRSVLEDIARASRGTTIRTRVIRLRRHFGQTAAMAAGFALACGNVIVPIDADRQNNPADIPRLLIELEKGFDVVSGWRRNRHDRVLSRKVPSWLANRLISRLSQVRLHDFGCTLKAYRAALLKELPLYGEMHRLLPLYLAQRGCRIAEVAVDHRPRTTGRSKYRPCRGVKVLLDLLLILFMNRYYTRPMHFFGQAAIGFALLACAAGTFMVILKYGMLAYVGIEYQASFTRTPLPELAASFLMSSVFSLFTGILAEILIRVHHESQGLKPYAIDEIRDSQMVD